MYDGFYNLNRKPFQLNADTDFFFNSAVHKRALAYMRYGLTQGEGFVVVTGKPGTGKTMLV
jgi:type II secretory pathway predicted ATPase ExeA